MASRLGRRAFLNVSRSASSARVVAGRNAGRRLMSTSAEHAHGGAKKDTAWQIGSAAIFGPMIFWVLTGQRQNKAKHDDHHGHATKHHSEPAPAHETSTPEPVKDDEGTAVPAEEVKESIQQAISEDSPKDAQVAEEEEAATPAPVTEEPSELKEETPKSEEPESTPAPAEQEEKPTTSEEKPSEAEVKSEQNPKEASESQ